jgi:hypothetical protein
MNEADTGHSRFAGALARREASVREAAEHVGPPRVPPMNDLSNKEQSMANETTDPPMRRKRGGAPLRRRPLPLVARLGPLGPDLVWVWPKRRMCGSGQNAESFSTARGRNHNGGANGRS